MAPTAANRPGGKFASMANAAANRLSNNIPTNRSTPNTSPQTLNTPNTNNIVPAPNAASRPGGKFASMANAIANRTSHDPSLPTTISSTNPASPPATTSVAAARPGGKFASMLQATSLSTNPSTSSSLTPNTLTITNTDPSSTVSGTTKCFDERHQQTVSTLARKRKLLRTHPVFRDLDEAERLALDLLALSSSSAESLARLASRPFQKRAGGGGVGSSSSTTGTNDGTTEEDEKEALEQQIRNNGKEYCEKLGRIYALLEPNAHLVASYGNLLQKTKKEGGAATGGGRTGVGVGAGGTGEEQHKQELQRKDRNNMYASRLEMRLAIERRDLMKEMVRLEKLECCEEEGDGGGAVTNKRKREVDDDGT